MGVSIARARGVFGLLLPRGHEATYFRDHVGRSCSWSRRAAALFFRIFFLSDLKKRISSTANNESATIATKTIVPMMLKIVICPPSVKGKRGCFSFCHASFGCRRSSRFRAFSMLASVRCGNRRSIAKMRSTKAMVSQVKPLSSNNVTTVSQVSLRRKNVMVLWVKLKVSFCTNRPSTAGSGLVHYREGSSANRGKRCRLVSGF
ncbi:hypothetical protein AWB65_05792 [Caballeronia humi]|uniref:Uncharacterized protein n=1 Tax=Caballeronia humi TaxID=326474 RepID=A0A158J1U6_9BURK|nr:hypothetical protein AWB65_05792 [Caballeronia humi]